MERHEAKAVMSQINRLFKESFFTICAIDKCMGVTGAQPNSDYKALALYHCVKFADMDDDEKRFVYRASVENVCNVDSFPEIQLVEPSEKVDDLMEVKQQPKSMLKRLFGTRES